MLFLRIRKSKAVLCRRKLEGQTAEIVCESILARSHHTLFGRVVFKEIRRYTKELRTVPTTKHKGLPNFMQFLQHDNDDDAILCNSPPCIVKLSTIPLWLTIKSFSQNSFFSVSRCVVLFFAPNCYAQRMSRWNFLFPTWTFALFLAFFLFLFIIVRIKLFCKMLKEKFDF